jgi:hypothetical protein
LFNGKPKASALVGSTVAFGLPLNDFRCGRIQFATTGRRCALPEGFTKRRKAGLTG